jgi:ferredoxin
MLEKKQIVLFYFSGTGNTTRIANEMLNAFSVYQFKAVLRNMVHLDSVELPDDCHVGLIFPVAIQSTFPNVWAFAAALPAGAGRKIFMADTMEQFSGGIVGPLKHLLTQKGYHCIGAREFKMSTSMQLGRKKQFEGEIKDKRALIDVDRYVRDLIEGRAKWRRIPILSDLMRGISKSPKVWQSMSQKITMDLSKCVGCGQCAHFCPMHAIEMKEGIPERSHELCIACMRCVNFCPVNAYKLYGKQALQKKVMDINAL